MDVKELVVKSVDEWNKKDKEAFLAYFTERSEITGPDGVTLHGLQGVEMFWEVWQGAFSDNNGTISDVFAAGNRACAEVTVASTHTGTLHLADGSQIPATGRQLCLRVAQVHTIRDGRFLTSHIYFDQFDLLTQLGLIPIHRVDSHRS
jgi:ketosteroid isomerase-like protein